MKPKRAIMWLSRFVSSSFSAAAEFPSPFIQAQCRDRRSWNVPSVVPTLFKTFGSQTQTNFFPYLSRDLCTFALLYCTFICLLVALCEFPLESKPQKEHEIRS